MAIGVVQLHIERFQPAQHRQTYTASGYRAHSHTLHGIRTRHAIPDVPTALHHPLIRGDVIAHERKDHHHHVLGDADAVAVGHLGDGDAPGDRGLAIGLIGADAGRNYEPEPWRLRDALTRH